MEVDFYKEISQNDTCIRFYSVNHFDINDKDVWENLFENLYNIVLIIPEENNNYENDPYYSSCNNIIFYCIDSNKDDMDKKMKNNQNIICKFYYNTGEIVKNEKYIKNSLYK
jgi:hypothetical protein